MPTISVFYGITIRMHWADHPPPHFHASYGEHEGVYDIASGKLLTGWLPRRARALILKWLIAHRDELMENWHACVTKQPLKVVPPLD